MNDFFNSMITIVSIADTIVCIGVIISFILLGYMRKLHKNPPSVDNFKKMIKYGIITVTLCAINFAIMVYNVIIIIIGGIKL